MTVQSISLNKRIRQAIREHRSQIEIDFQRTASIQIAQQLIALLEGVKFQKVATYFAEEGEVDPIFYIQHCLTHGKELYAPFSNLEQKSIQFYPYQMGEPLVKNKHNIPEPVLGEKKELPPQELDLLLLPLVAFNEKGYRLGRGVGFYDRTFAFRKTSKAGPILVGLAYEFQKNSQFQVESWDIPMSYIVTESKIYSC